MSIIFNFNKVIIDNSDNTTQYPLIFFIEKGMEQAFYEAVVNEEVIAVKADKSDIDNK